MDSFEYENLPQIRTWISGIEPQDTTELCYFIMCFKQFLALWKAKPPSGVSIPRCLHHLSGSTSCYLRFRCFPRHFKASRWFWMTGMYVINKTKACNLIAGICTSFNHVRSDVNSIKFGLTTCWILYHNIYFSRHLQSLSKQLHHASQIGGTYILFSKSYFEWLLHALGHGYDHDKGNISNWIYEGGK